MRITPDTYMDDWMRGETFDDFMANPMRVQIAGVWISRVTYLPTGYFDAPASLPMQAADDHDDG